MVEVAEPEKVKGRWLVDTVSRSGWSDLAEIRLRKAREEKPEPPPETDTISVAAGGANGEPIGGNGLYYPLSEGGKFLGGVAAHKARPFGNWQSDNAVDIGAPEGTDVYAVEDGTITKLGGSWRSAAANPNGYNVTLRGRSGRSWFYTHQRRRAPLSVGASVNGGQYLGESGSANSVAHLHIGVDKGDPAALLHVRERSSG